MKKSKNKQPWDRWLNDMRKFITSANPKQQTIVVDSKMATELYDAGLTPQQAAEKLVSGKGKVLRIPRCTLRQYLDDVAARLKAEDYQGVIDEDIIGDAYDRGVSVDDISDILVKNAAFDGMSGLDEWEEEENI